MGRLFIPGSQMFKRSMLVFLLVLAIVLRALVFHVETTDYTFFVSQWYDFIKTHNGFAAFKYDFYNYNPPYLYLLAGMLVVVVGVLILGSKEPLTLAIQLKIALVFVLVIPFLLPEMHERYFYLADVITIIFAFYFSRSFYIAVIMQLCSLLSYAPYLLNREVVSLKLVAGGVLVIAIVSLADLLLALYPSIRKRIGKQVLVRTVP